MGNVAKTASVRRDHHDNERARPLAVVSIVLLHANEIHSAQNSLLGVKQHLRSPRREEPHTLIDCGLSMINYR